MVPDSIRPAKAGVAVKSDVIPAANSIFSSFCTPLVKPILKSGFRIQIAADITPCPETIAKSDK